MEGCLKLRAHASSKPAVSEPMTPDPSCFCAAMPSEIPRLDPESDTLDCAAVVMMGLGPGVYGFFGWNSQRHDLPSATYSFNSHLGIVAVILALLPNCYYIGDPCTD